MFMLRSALVLLVLLAGCASTSTSGSASSASNPPVAAVPVPIEKTGGIAGIRDTTQIDAIGNWTRSHKTVKTTSGTLTGAQVTQLQALATDPKLAGEAAAAAQAAPTKCADTFNYTISAGPVALRFNDCPSDTFQ